MWLVENSDLIEDEQPLYSLSDEIQPHIDVATNRRPRMPQVPGDSVIPAGGRRHVERWSLNDRKFLFGGLAMDLARAQRPAPKSRTPITSLFNGGKGGTRTLDPGIMSAVL